MYTSDPYEPSGVVAIFNTDEEKERLLKEYYEKVLVEKQRGLLSGWWNWLPEDQRQEKAREEAERETTQLEEIEIPISILGQYW